MLEMKTKKVVNHTKTTRPVVRVAVRSGRMVAIQPCAKGHVCFRFIKVSDRTSESIYDFFLSYLSRESIAARALFLGSSVLEAVC